MVHQISKHDIHLWLIDQDDDRWSRTAVDLSTLETRRMEALAFDYLQRRFFARYIALRSILARYVGTSASSLVFATEEYGRPYLHDYNLMWNMSHASRYALVGVAGSAVQRLGVDIEWIDTDSSLLRIADRYFTAAECFDIYSQPAGERLPHFYRYWTAKEAYIKATGLGLQTPLHEVVLELSPARYTFSAVPKIDGLHSSWHVADADLGLNSYMASWVTQTKIDRASILLAEEMCRW